MLLGGLGAASLPVTGRAGLDLARDDDFLTAIAKMRGSTDDRLVMGFVIGTRYAVIESRATPMLGILAATFSRYRRIREDAYEVHALEIAYFTDPDSGELLTRWHNPFTDTTVDVPRVRMGPSRSIMTARGLTVETAAGEAVGMSLSHRFRPPVVHGDVVWVTEEILVQGQPRGAGRPFSYNEMTTYQARRSDLDDPERATVPTRVDFHGLVSFRPWMGFGAMPGHTTARASGLRVERVDDLPRYYLELTERFHPEVLDDPLAALDGDPA